MNEKLDRFQKCFDEYQTLVMKAAEHYVDYGTAEDIVQEAFWEFYQNMDKIPDSKVKSWLLVVVDHRARNYKKLASTRKDIYETKEEIAAHEEIELEKSAEEIVFEQEERKTAREFARAVLSKLYEKDRKWYHIIVNTVCAGMSAKDVADQLGMTPNHVNVSKKRARSYLKKEFEDQYKKYCR